MQISSTGTLSIKDEIKQDSEDLILRQIGRLEAQRTRIMENIAEKKIYDMRYEKMLLEIDGRINGMLLRINPGKVTSEVSEDLIKDTILFLIIKHRSHDLKKENILSEIINMEQCTMTQDDAVFSEMENIGLKCCKKFSSIEFYDLLEFAYMRKYVLPSDKFIEDVNLLDSLEMNSNDEKLELSMRYYRKYGREETWTDEVFTKHDEDEKKIMQKYAETSSKVAIKALEGLPNQEAVKEHIKYVNVFFGKDKSNMINF